jgi:hypothetical protein
VKIRQLACGLNNLTLGKRYLRSLEWSQNGKSLSSKERRQKYELNGFRPIGPKGDGGIDPIVVAPGFAAFANRERRVSVS